jgi:hypothetical protein
MAARWNEHGFFFQCQSCWLTVHGRDALDALSKFGSRQPPDGDAL